MVLGLGLGHRAERSPVGGAGWSATLQGSASLTSAASWGAGPGTLLAGCPSVWDTLEAYPHGLPSVGLPRRTPGS